MLREVFLILDNFSKVECFAENPLLKHMKTMNNECNRVFIYTMKFLLPDKQWSTLGVFWAVAEAVAVDRKTSEAVAEAGAVAMGKSISAGGRRL